MLISKKEAEKYAFSPYELCPCQSEIKYKFCCYKKSQNINNNKNNFSTGFILNEAHKIFKETNFETCYGFNKTECSSEIIRAHSLQNNGVLDKITYKNHLYHLKLDIKNNSPTLKFEKIGKNLASVFTGFCKYHDEFYFSMIEDDDYKGTDEQNFWFAFRAFCLETHKKNRLAKHYSRVFQKYPQATRMIELQVKYKVCQLDLKDDQIEYKKLKEIYKSGTYEKLESFVKTLPFKIGFTGTTAVAVQVDINGKKAADIYNYDDNIFIPSLYISVIPQNNKSLIIVTRKREDTCYEDLIKSLKTTNDNKLLYQYISFCLAEYSENVFFSPNMIDNLTENKKKIITSAFEASLQLDVESRIKATTLGFQLNLFELKY